MSSGTLRGTSLTARADECEKITGASRDANRVFHRVRRDVAEVDEHAEPVHLAHDLFAERRQPVEHRRVGRRVGPRDVLRVRQRHVARAEAVEHAQRAERAVDRVPAFHADERRDLALLEDALDVVGGQRQLEVSGYLRIMRWTMSICSSVAVTGLPASSAGT